MSRPRGLLVAALVLLSGACGSKPDPEAATHARSAPGTAVDSGAAATFAGARPSGLKVLVVGLDGATFDVLRPLAEAGELPVLRRLMQEGCAAPLQSLRPMLSPAIWTTIATGHRPERHGIEHFLTQREPRRLVSTADRRTHALWTIADAAGLTSGLAGWWVTWPPEQVRGWIVSDRTALSRHQQWNEAQVRDHLTHPPALLERVARHVVDPAHPPLQELRALADFAPAELDEMLRYDAAIVAHAPTVIKTAWCEQRTYEEAFLDLLADGQPDLGMLLLIATDAASHTTWHYYQPEKFPGVPEEEARRLGTIIPATYRHNDRFLSRLLGQLEDDTVVIIVSDHGFQASGELPRPRLEVEMVRDHKTRLEDAVSIGQSGVHQVEGVFIAWGGPVRAGASCERPPWVLDIAPTILALLGLPVAGDMPGRVLEEILEPGFLAQHPVRRIDSYEGLLERPAASLPPADVSAERLEYLRALGYVR